MPLFTNAKRKEENSKFIFTEHVIKRDMNRLVKMSNIEKRYNMRDKRFIKGISNRRKRFKEASKTTFNGFKMNKGKRIF